MAETRSWFAAETVGVLPGSTFWSSLAVPTSKEEETVVPIETGGSVLGNLVELVSETVLASLVSV